MIVVERLSKAYGEVMAVKDVSFSVASGQVVGLLGPNGAGKSTTMKVITGFLPADHGRVEIGGFDIFESPMEAKRHIGFLPEELPLYPEMRVTEYLEFVARLRGVEDLPKGIDQAIEKSGLGDVQNRVVGNLSRGYRQRVGIAQALVHSPEILIFDEPTLGLDPNQVVEIRHLIQNLKSHHTVVLSTHILSEVELICDDVVILNQGSVLAHSSIDSLHKSFSKKTVSLRFCGSPPMDKLEQHEFIKGHSPELMGSTITFEKSFSDREMSVFLREVSQWDPGLLEARVNDMNLESIFVEMTKGPV